MKARKFVTAVAQASTSIELQWGRADEGAEIHAKHGLLAHDLVASMGPRR